MATLLEAQVSASVSSENDKVSIKVTVGTDSFAVEITEGEIHYKGARVVISKNTHPVHVDFDISDPDQNSKVSTHFQGKPDQKAAPLSSNSKVFRAHYPANQLDEVFSDIDAVMS